MPLPGSARGKEHREEPREIIAGSVFLIILMSVFALLALAKDHHTTATVLAVLGGVFGVGGILVGTRERRA